MTDVQQLLSDFIAADRSGEDPDPGAYLRQVEGADRSELEALIDAYLSRAPRRPFDEAAFAASPAAATTEALARSLAGGAGSWPALLPRLRHRAQLRRAELVEQLAQALGVADRSDKVGAYYHAMEQGSLPAASVSDTVLQALGRILGEPAARLREAGRSFVTGPADEPSATFARVARPAEDFDEGTTPLAGAASPADQRDEVDELFTGGPSAG